MNLKPVFSVLTLSLARSQLAGAQSRSGAILSCRPRYNSQGAISSVRIRKDHVTAEFDYGFMSNARIYTYSVQRTGSATLNAASFDGPDFSLQVDFENSSADLYALVNGRQVTLKNLVCLFNEFDPHPGVTMSN